MNDELKRQYEIAEAEQRYVEAKEEHGRDSKQAKAAKAKMHELRDVYRAERDARGGTEVMWEDNGDGSTTVSPRVIKATTHR